MIYTDGKGTIANVREDNGLKVSPHVPYVMAEWENVKDLPEDERQTVSDALLAQ